MHTAARNGSPERVLIDLNTQCDFLLPAGALPVANRADLLPRIRKLMNWVRLQQIPVISSLEANRQGEVERGFPPHCVDRSRGQRKLPFTLLPKRVFLAGDNTLDVPYELFRRYQQVIFTKRNRDFLSNPKADRLVNSLTPSYWMVMGVTVSHCVRSVVLGLLARHQRVVVIQDACGYWSGAEAEISFRMMDAKGAVLITTDDLYKEGAEEDIRARCDARMTELHFHLDDGGANGTNGNGNGRHSTNGNGHGNGNGNGSPNGTTSPMPIHHSRDEHDKPAASNGKSHAKANGNGNGKLHSEIADLIPTHLLKRKSRPARPARPSIKPPRGLA